MFYNTLALSFFITMMLYTTTYFVHGQSVIVQSEYTPIQEACKFLCDHFTDCSFRDRIFLSSTNHSFRKLLFNLPKREVDRKNYIKSLIKKRPDSPLYINLTLSEKLLHHSYYTLERQKHKSVIQQIFNAIDSNDLEGVRQGLMNNVNPGVVYKPKDSSILLYAASHGHPTITQLVIEKTPCQYLTSKDEHGYTVLHYASKKDHREIAEMLIKKTDPQHLTLQNSAKNTPLHLAIYSGHLEIAEMLIKKTGPQYLTLQNDHKDTALHLAINNGHSKTAKMLIEKTGPQYLTLQGYRGDTALHLVIRFGYYDKCPTRIEIAKTLIKIADPQDLIIQNISGDTALHLAIHSGYRYNCPIRLEIAEMLVQKIGLQGLTVQNKTGQTPLDYAPLKIKFQLLYKNPTLLRIMIGQKTICFSLLTLIVILLYKLM